MWNRDAALRVTNRIPIDPMKPWIILLAGLLMACVALTSRADPLNFSRGLTPIQRMNTGVARLSPGQIKALDALIQRDEAALLAGAAASPQSARFSDRLTASERRSAGVDLLNESELTKLNALVAQNEAESLAAKTSVSGTMAMKPEIVAFKPQIHGTVSFMVGTGSGGYSAVGGAMTLNYDDPAHGVSVMVGYSQTRTKGGYYYPDCGPGFGFYPGNPFGDPFLYPRY